MGRGISVPSKAPCVTGLCSCRAQQLLEPGRLLREPRKSRVPRSSPQFLQQRCFVPQFPPLIKRLVEEDPVINTALPHPHWGGTLPFPRSKVLGDRAHLSNGPDTSLPKEKWSPYLALTRPLASQLQLQSPAQNLEHSRHQINVSWMTGASRAFLRTSSLESAALIHCAALDMTTLPVPPQQPQFPQPPHSLPALRLSSCAPSLTWSRGKGEHTALRPQDSVCLLRPEQAPKDAPPSILSPTSGTQQLSDSGALAVAQLQMPAVVLGTQANKQEAWQGGGGDSVPRRLGGPHPEICLQL